MVEEILKKLDYKKCGYFFVVSVNAGGVAGTNIAIKKTIEKCGGTLAAGFSLPLVSNYILFGNIPYYREWSSNLASAVRTMPCMYALVS
jgi:hypothetical protein